MHSKTLTTNSFKLYIYNHIFRFQKKIYSRNIYVVERSFINAAQIQHMDNFSVIMFVSEKNDIGGNNFKKFLDLLQSLLNVYGEEVALKLSIILVVFSLQVLIPHCHHHLQVILKGMYGLCIYE